MRLRRSLGEDTRVPGVAPRNRSQPDQNTGHHQHDAPTVSQRCPTTDRQIGRPQQIHLLVRRAKPTFPQNNTLRKRLRMGTRASGGLRFTKAASVRTGDSFKPQPLAVPVALRRASPHAVSAALVQEQDREGTTRQCPVYYVSEVLTASKCNMTELEKKFLRSSHGFEQIAPLF